MTPAVSVLMPVYNAERYLAPAVDSILAQTFTDFEFLIVDDGSTDGSLAILQNYAQRDPRIRLVSRPNTGYVVALNEMLDMARGEFLARMDADDIALPERFARQVEFLNDQPEVVAVGSQALAIDPEGNPLCLWSVPTDHDTIVARHLQGESQIHHPTLMTRRNAAIAVNGYRPEYLYVEDYDLYLRLEETGGRLANLPDTLLMFRRNLNSVMHSQARNHSSRLQRLIEETYARRGLPGPPPQVNTTSVCAPPAHYFRMWAWGALRSGYRHTAIKYARKALAAEPFNSESWRLAYCTLRGH